MARNKPDKNQLDLVKELADAENLSALPISQESAADKALREINEKLVIAEQNKIKKEEGVWVDTSLKNIRAQIEARERDRITEDKETNEERVVKDDDEAFKPGDEYYGRFNKFRKSK